MRSSRRGGWSLAALVLLTANLAAQSPFTLPNYTLEQRWLRAAQLNIINTLGEQGRLKGMGVSAEQYGQMLFDTWHLGWTATTPFSLFTGLYNNKIYPDTRCDLQVASDTLVRAECNRPYAAYVHGMAYTNVSLAEFETAGRVLSQLLARERGLEYSEMPNGNNVVITIRRATGRPAAIAAAAPAKTDTAAARAAFRDALGRVHSLWSLAQRRTAANRAVELAPDWGIARALQIFTGFGTNPEKEAALGHLLGEMPSATPAELLLTTYWKESAGGRAAAALPLMKTAAELMPEEAGYQWGYVIASQSGKSLAEQIKSMRDFQQRFPNYAASHLQLAYTLSSTDPAAALVEAKEYLRLAPGVYNAIDTYVDALLLTHQATEAKTQALVEYQTDSVSSAGGYIKSGAAALQLGDPVTARSWFTRAYDRFTGQVFRVEMLHWNAASYLYAGDVPNGMTALGNMLSGANLSPAQQALVHARMATVEAYLGDKGKVAGHLTAAGDADQNAVFLATKAIALARSGDLDGARTAAAQYAKLVQVTNLFPHTLNALIAIQAKDLKTAEGELAKAWDGHPLTRALQADLLLRKGQKKQSDAIRQDLSTGIIHNISNSYVDWFRVMAKMHVDKM
jgi:hypothetical protein